MNKAIFEHFPELKSACPCLNFADLPAPITKFGGPPSNIWIKRDDLSHSEYGGNKVRKLEFILADALEANKKRILTFGAIGSNHGVATTYFGSKYKLSTNIILFDQAISDTVLNNLRLMWELGAKLDYRKTIAKTAFHFYQRSLFEKRQTYSLFAGGSNVVGCLGFVNAAFELKMQIDAQLIPEPDYLYCPVGSSATLAGLTLGCNLLGLKTKVIGVRVAPSHLGPIETCTDKTIAKLMMRTANYLKHRSDKLEIKKAPQIHLNNYFFGDGYGLSTTASKAALKLFAAHHINLESTYTAKTAAAVLSHAQAEKDKTFVYWHTFNSRDTNLLPASSKTYALPQELKALLTPNTSL
ncbi:MULTISPECIES: 1-aminocyclopropane-1-carboxylate deaminase/D-cysteine desulfhydrase [unclassified Oleiphilus]|jgi:D-cysteine desulfhydrase|nr:MULTISPECIES: pyridoxal-phosphate dependent enzyme [unclassified Oleiphilus]KZY40903.1 hypothetical protein A3732_03295 [Oleiphilus sp. HI0050]KZY73239.1 hypothetical protein A3740_19460 [Oleiphilus sp. HI0068]KZY80600.1 hypothetical protein A3741_05300 [Oleiphilus sp. HI0069]KZY31366.1 hypothetical protein A3729_09165 [Oleiphilus sp. HI0043]KZY60351.1 hypothetical protein A3735_12845 [Oleiphilus sp. HI0061]